LFAAFYDRQNMSSKSSDSDHCSVSDDSEFNYIPGNYTVIESEIMEASDSENSADDKHESTSGVEIRDVEPYSCEPMADEEWIAEYRQRQAEKEQRLTSLEDRLAGRENISNW
jgi:hypothetical protein